MSKELMNVKRDNLKSKIKDLFIVFMIIILGVTIIFFSFKISYEKRISKNVNYDQSNLENNSIIKEDIQVSKQNQISNNAKEENAYEKNITEEKSDDEKIEKEETKVEDDFNQLLPEWTDTAIEDIKNIYGSDEKQVYLTFDDGPSKEITPQILKILEEEQVPATFFVLGKCVDNNPDLVKQEYEAGHFIANHGYTHTYSQIYSSIDNVVNEYNQTNESIKKAIGNENYDCHLFRFPGGSSGGPYDSLKAQAKQYLADNQVASTNWNCLTSDAAGNYTVQEQYAGAIETQGNKTSLIILMHDASDKRATPETVRLLIKHYKEEGYVFKNFYDIFKKTNTEIVENVEYVKDIN